ncbi:type I glutamate--ammonia ligase [bacterium]|nr:type I glutamate--ammonia ligase [bacterium]
MKKEDILKLIKSKKIKFIRMLFTDITGAPKNVEIPVSQINKALNGEIAFDGSSIEGFARIEESDMLLCPDLDTFAIVPWNKNSDVAQFICDVKKMDRTPFEGSPRYLLKRIMDNVKKTHKYIMKAGPEVEFFLFKKNGNNEENTTVLHDKAGYFDLLQVDKGEKVREDIVLNLEQLGFEVEAAHHEVAPGQHEIDFKFDNILKTADNVITFKIATKTIALFYDLHASFLPKPVKGINGSGMHCNLSLFSGKKNIFYSPKNKYELSKEALYFIGGILKHARAISFITNPIINSYKRLVPGYEAPVYLSWATRNRSTLIRIPATRGLGTRVEFRSPDPSANPYLAFTVLLAAGMDGIKNKIDPGDPINENIYELTEKERKRRKVKTLPGDLKEAMSEFNKDKILKDALGPFMVEKLNEIKRKELEEFSIHVTDWEIEKYFDIY